jgi:hypothetical protein
MSLATGLYLVPPVGYFINSPRQHDNGNRDDGGYANYLIKPIMGLAVGGETHTDGVKPVYLVLHNAGSIAKLGDIECDKRLEGS